MLTRIVDWILGREPVLTSTGVAAVVTALAGVLTAFDVVDLTAEQIAALGALAAAVAGFAARPVVTPVAGPTQRHLSRVKQELAHENAAARGDTVAGDSRIEEP